MEELFEEEDPAGRRLLASLRDRIALDRGAVGRRMVLSQKIKNLDDMWHPTLG
jgi:hypothetical protein